MMSKASVISVIKVQSELESEVEKLIQTTAARRNRFSVGNPGTLSSTGGRRIAKICEIDRKKTESKGVQLWLSVRS